MLTPAAQFYTLRDYCKTLTDIEATFEKVKAMGYTAIQMSGMNFSEPAKLAKLVEKYGFDVCLTHMPYDRVINDTKAIVEEHKAYGCPIIGIGGLPDQYRSSKEGYYEFAKLANAAARKLREYDMGFSYHNHAFELNRYEGERGLDILLDNTDDNVYFTLDLFWLQMGGAFPADYLAKTAGRVKVAHFKDLTTKGNTPMMAPVGAGNMDYQKLTKAAQDAGVVYAAVEQDDCYDADPFDCLKLSLENIQTYLKKING